MMNIYRIGRVRIAKHNSMIQNLSVCTVMTVTQTLGRTTVIGKMEQKLPSASYVERPSIIIHLIKKRILFNVCGKF